MVVEGSILIRGEPGKDGKSPRAQATFRRKPENSVWPRFTPEFPLRIRVRADHARAKQLDPGRQHGPHKPKLRHKPETLIVKMASQVLQV